MPQEGQSNQPGTGSDSGSIRVPAGTLLGCVLGALLHGGQWTEGSLAFGL